MKLVNAVLKKYNMIYTVRNRNYLMPTNSLYLSDGRKLTVYSDYETDSRIAIDIPGCRMMRFREEYWFFTNWDDIMWIKLSENIELFKREVLNPWQVKNAIKDMIETDVSGEET